MMVKHGMADTSEYKSYTAAKQRCTNPKCEKYPGYGGRGIEFRLADFPAFFSELGLRPVGRVLDRIDNDGHYEAGNVRWTTRSRSQKNRRPPTEETIAKRAAKLRGQKRTPEFCRRMSEMKKGNKSSVGRKVSVETRYRMRLAALRRIAREGSGRMSDIGRRGLGTRWGAL